MKVKAEIEQSMVHTNCNRCGSSMVFKFGGGSIRFCPNCGKRLGVLDFGELKEWSGVSRGSLLDGTYGTYIEVNPVATDEERKMEVDNMVTKFASKLLCNNVYLIEKRAGTSPCDPLCLFDTVGIKCQVKDGELIFKLKEGYNNESET